VAADRGRSRAAAPGATGGDRGTADLADAAARQADLTAGSTVADPAVTAAAAARAIADTGAATEPAEAAGPLAATPADRVVAEAMGRIRITTQGGVPGLESRIDDPTLGTIRLLVSARPGETIRAELVAADPAAARELRSALDRALAAGVNLPTGVDLRVRAEGPARPSAADSHLGSGTGQQGHAPADQQLPGDRRHDDQPAFAFGREGSNGQPDSPTRGRERRPGPITVVPTASVPAARSRTALDVRA
jgi:hypothetical protein